MASKYLHFGYLALMALALSGIGVLVSSLAMPQPASGSVGAPTELIPRAYLPLVVRLEDPPVPHLTIYDKYGTLQDWDWLVDRFGDVTLDRGTGAASVLELREVEGDMALIVQVQNIHGEPVVGQQVVFYWPDAPPLLPYQQYCGLDRGLIIATNENGKSEFIMGSGAWYDPNVGVGPHQVWVVTGGTDCLAGLGWFDFHIHLDSVWVLP